MSSCLLGLSCSMWVWLIRYSLGGTSQGCGVKTYTEADLMEFLPSGYHLLQECSRVAPRIEVVMCLRRHVYDVVSRYVKVDKPCKNVPLDIHSVLPWVRSICLVGPVTEVRATEVVAATARTDLARTSS